jgi:hypothetical protein
MRKLLVLLVVVVSLGRMAGAGEPRAYVERMFAAERSKAGQAAASAAYAELRKAAPADPRADYACALALVRQQRVPQAHGYLDRYLAAVPADVQARQMKIYLHLQAREIDAALAACRTIAEQLPKVPTNDPEWSEAARFLGVVVGYLEQAYVETSGKGDSRLQQKNDLLAVLPAQWLEELDAGRLQVANRLAELQSAQTAKQDRVVAEREQKKEMVETTIDQRKTEIAFNDQQLQANAETVRDAQRQLTVIQGQLNSLLADRSVLAAQLLVAQARFLEMQERLTEVSGNTRVPVQNISIADAAIFNNLGLSLAALSKQMFNLDRRILTLRGQAAELMTKAQQSGQVVAESQQAIAASESRTQSLEKQALRLDQAKQPAARRMTAQMRSLATYLPSPLEREQGRVLAWFD